MAALTRLERSALTLIVVLTALAGLANYGAWADAAALRPGHSRAGGPGLGRVLRHGAAR